MSTWNMNSRFHKEMVKSSFFWFITQQVVVIPYRTFRTTNWSHLQDDTNWLFCHRNMLLSVTRSDTNFSTVFRAGQLQNRELRVMRVVFLGGYLSLQNVIHETWHIRVYLVCVCVCVRESGWTKFQYIKPISSLSWMCSIHFTIPVFLLCPTI